MRFSSLVQEEFNAGNPFNVEGLKYLPRKVHGGDVHRSGNVGRCGRDIEYVVGVFILDGTEMSEFTVQSPRGHHGQFHDEIDKRFEDGILPLH